MNQLSTMTALQLIVFIMAIECVTALVLSITYNTILSIYYRVKDNHTGRVLNAVSQTIEKATKDISEKVAKKKENGSEALMKFMKDMAEAANKKKEGEKNG